MSNLADEEARSTWLAERPDPDHDYYPDPDHDYYDDGLCDWCGMELRRNKQTGRCRICGYRGSAS